MWNRIKRLFRAMFGWLLKGAEDPELILTQLREDLRSKIPELNRQVAEIVKHQKMLEMQLERKTDDVARLRPQVEAAVRAGAARKEAAVALIMQLQTAEKELEDTRASLERAKENSEKTLRMRAAYEAKIRQQMDEAMRQIARHKRAQMESEMANLMGSFEAGDEVETLERMTEQVDERLARAQARLDVAQTSVDSQIMQIQQDAAVDTAETTYAEYQRRLGLVPDQAAETPKTMTAIPVQAEPEQEPPVPPETVEQADTSADGNWAQPRRDTETQQ